MTCPRGAANPDAHTQRMLFAASGGYCQNPACSLELFINYPEKKIHVAEMAHVFAANSNGPRANDLLSDEQRGSFDNLVLLCSLCHTKIDKAPEVYPDPVILKWKRDHAEKLRSLFGVIRFEKRSDAREVIEGFLRENYQIFENYGPQINEAKNPESGASERWKRKVLQKVIPNNRRILSHLDANKHLLNGLEEKLLEQFRQHIDDLEARHIQDYNEGASQFPIMFSEILKD